MRPLLLLLGLIGALGVLTAQSPSWEPRIAPAPGSYPSPLQLTVAPPADASVRYRFLDSQTSQTIPWTEPLTLEALPGEHRTYTLRLTLDLATGESTTRDFRYEVDGYSEPQATIRPVPGTFRGPVTLHPTLPTGWVLSLDGREAPEPLILDAPLGESKTYALVAQGPGSAHLSWVYKVDRRDQEAVSLQLVSPLPGSWANGQPLVATFRGVDRVLWSFGPHLDPVTAQVYTGPILLDSAGPKTVTVAARSRVDGRWLEKTVTWTTDPGASPPGWPGSGVLTSGLNLPKSDGWDVSWDEGRSWQPSLDAVLEAPSPWGRKVLSAQARRDGRVARMVWWLDARKPATPSARFEGGWNPKLVLSGSSEAYYRVQWTFSDGKVLEDPMVLWGPVGDWKVPDRVVGARVWGQGPNGLESDPGTVGFAETGWSVPGWEPWDLHGPVTGMAVEPLGGRVPTRAGFRVAYEVSDKPDVPEPGRASAWLDGGFFPKVPWGAARTFYARFAWRDDAGLTGPSTPVVAVRVNRVPPLVPQVEVSGGHVYVRPADGDQPGTDLLWAVSADRATASEALTFQSYQAPLDLASLLAGTPGTLWFHARAQNHSGSVGPARLNIALGPPKELTDEVVQVDPDPAVGESPVVDGGVYPWPQFRLRALGASRDLWVGATDHGTSVPDDWSAQVQPWTAVFSRTVGPGERRTFLVYWNLKTTEGWAWAQPKTLTLTLDLGPPAAPVVAEDWPHGPLGQSWTLNLKTGRPGDSLKYSFSTDGADPGDPVTVGQPWPGSKTWTPREGEKLEVRVRVAAVSVSGLAVEMPSADPVVIDRTIPAAVIPPLEPFTYRFGPWVLTEPPGTKNVRYTLTSDGSPPGIPTWESSSVVQGLSLEGIPGRSVLYRFRWRSFSSTGVPGPVSEPYAVLIDRTGAPSGAGASDSSRSDEGLRVEGLPSSGVSASPVTLKLNGAPGLFHYELSEGLVPSRPVTPESPVWDQPLVLDGGPGVDRSFSLSVRGFGPDGAALSAEQHYSVRVDQSIPPAPVVTLVPDQRRPEAVLVQKSERNPDETLYFRWLWTSYPDGRGQTDWQTPEAEAPRFLAPGGKLTKLVAQAYLKDEAGNQGPVSEVNLLVDQNVVYVTPGGTGTGTRLDPTGDIAASLDLARRQGKSILLVAAGAYPVSRTLDLSGFRVFGGLAPDQWETTLAPGRSVWTASGPFTGSSFLVSGDRDWSLAQVDVQTGAVSFDRVVDVQGASVVVRKGSWSWAGSGSGWGQTGGSLDVVDLTVADIAQPQGVLFDLSRVKTTVRRFDLVATHNQGVLFSLRDCQGLFQDLAIVSRNSVGFDNVWLISGGQVTFDGLRILAGDGAPRASGFVLKQTDAVVFNAEISLFGSASNTGVQVAGGRFEGQKINLNLLKGSEYNQGVVADQGDLELRTFHVKVDSGTYQNGLSMDGGHLTLVSGRVELQGGGQNASGAQFLAPTLVNVQDVAWVLTTKTPGDLWRIDKPWADGSVVDNSQATGW